MLRAIRPLLAASLLVPLARGGDRFVVVPFDSLRFEGGTPPAAGEAGAETMSDSSRADFYEAYAVLDGPGDAFLEIPAGEPWERRVRRPERLALRLPDGAPASGRVFLAKADLSGFEAHKFAVAPETGDAASKDRFYAAMESHYSRLLERGLPGSAWFRHQVAAARAARNPSAGGAGPEPANPSWRASPRTFDDTLDLFSGGRALAENLDIDRTLRGIQDEKADVDVASIQGVTTRPMDWKPLVADLKPSIDPLARLVPADQHAIFFPSFDAMVRVFDEIDRAGTPLVQFADARAEDQLTKERYQEQLCLPLSTVSRLLGPAVVQSVAITGSDPYFPSGTDVALLFECKEPALLEKLVQARHLEARSKGAAPVQVEAGALACSGVATADRRISSYLAKTGSTVVVANSAASIRRIAAVVGGEPSLAATDEYVWFRHRYERGDPGESALLVLSDATIRRWASPASRIGDSRRIRAAAAMHEVEARHLDALVAGSIRSGTPASEPDLPASADFAWDSGGVRSATYGRPTFLTPLVELRVDRVGASEKRAYEAFRSTFQDRWRAFFDPIALRLSFADGKLAADLTVMPLGVSTEYKDLRDLTRDATLSAAAGDPHDGTLFHVAAAFGKSSWLSREFSGGLGPLGRELGADPLGWIGGGAAIYAEKDPFWDELRRASGHHGFLEENFYRLPLALHIEVKDPLKLAAFLTGVRAMAEGSAPGMMHWETRTWHDQGYVRIGVDPSAGLGGAASQAALCYAAMPDGLVLSLREELVQRAIDRRAERKAGKSPPERDRPWLGTSLGLRAEKDAVELLGGLWTAAPADELQLAGWAALPILDEWKRRFPAEDPVKLHERIFGVRLTTPGGGTFAWNESLGTMEASDDGSPAAPRDGPKLPQALARYLRGEFGLSFEGEGLRARVSIDRESAK